MERGCEKSKLQKEKEALRDLVKPEDQSWGMRFTEMSDYDQIIRRIMSIANWEEDMQLVELFITMRSRKHQYQLKQHSYFHELHFKEEDSVIVPNVLAMGYRQPSTDGLSDQQRKLTLLVHSFLSTPFNIYEGAAYDKLFKQFEKVEKWRENPLLVELYEKVKACEEQHHYWIRTDEPKEATPLNESVRVLMKARVKEIDKQITILRERGGIKTLAELDCYLYKIHNCGSWWKEERMMYWHRILGSELRILQLKEQGNWNSRITGLTKESPQLCSEKSTKEGLVSWIWGKIRPHKNSQ